MLYRCRWCEHAYCEDCLDFDETTLIGNNLQEYELLSYPEMTQAFYIQCAPCTNHFKEYPQDEQLCNSLAQGIRLEHERRFGDVSREGSTHAGSLTDATTVETPGVNTPIVIDDDDDFGTASSSRKRKLKLEVGGGSFKKGRKGV
jgi:SWI/SNF-related matrix-associated actin-dependent regulator of chromatin subfamily A member 5